MYKINYKNIIGVSYVMVIFLLVGVFFLVNMSFIDKSTNSINDKFDSSIEANNIEVIQTTTTTDNGDYYYTAKYNYIVDEIEYTCSSNVKSTSQSTFLGDITILYDSQNPSSCMPDLVSSFGSMSFMVYIVPIIFIIVGGLSVLKTFINIKKAKYLSNHGTLIKNLEYSIIDSNLTVNGSRKQCLLVDYEFPNGSKKQLKSHPIMNNVLSDGDGKCDMLIDFENPTNYYIALNIDIKK